MLAGLPPSFQTILLRTKTNHTKSGFEVIVSKLCKVFLDYHITMPHQPCCGKYMQINKHNINQTLKPLFLIYVRLRNINDTFDLIRGIGEGSKEEGGTCKKEMVSC